MSFYMDEDDAGDHGDEFLCFNCGGTESYADPSTGLLCCTQCFTQSQSQPNTQLDFEEVHGLAARTAGGRIKVFSARRRLNQKSREKQDLKEIDKSVPFPNVTTCLLGMQQVLQEGASYICNLANVSVEEERRCVNKLVQNLWRSYLRAWTDATEHYGKLHPGARFSLRDAFVKDKYHDLVVKHLSWKAEEGLTKSRIQEPQKIGLNEEPDELDMLPKQQDEFKVDDGNNETTTFTENTRKKCSRSNRMKLFSLHRKDDKQWGRLEAALRLQPSMTFCAAILWIATLPVGVAGYNILEWIANGSLPLFNAFNSMLGENERQALQPVRPTFCLSRVPNIELLEFQAQLLMVACAYTPSKEQGNKKKSNIRLVINEGVPHLAARLVRDFGLGQSVLDVALSLMNIPNASTGWSPTSLAGAQPENLISVAHVLAVIVVACKMCHPHFHNWTFARPFIRRPSNDNHNHQKFVPWNKTHSLLAGNGPSSQGYFEFLGKICNDEPLSQYRDFFVESDLPNKTTTTNNRQEIVVRPNETLTGKQIGRRPVNQLDGYLLSPKPKDERNRSVHYQLLLECMAYKTHVDPSAIHSKVVQLDEEISKKLQDRLEHSSKRKRKRKTPLSSKKRCFQSSSEDEPN